MAGENKPKRENLEKWTKSRVPTDDTQFGFGFKLIVTNDAYFDWQKNLGKIKHTLASEQSLAESHEKCPRVWKY